MTAPPWTHLALLELESSGARRSQSYIFVFKSSMSYLFLCETWNFTSDDFEIFVNLFLVW